MKVSFFVIKLQNKEGLYMFFTSECKLLSMTVNEYTTNGVN